MGELRKTELVVSRFNEKEVIKRILEKEKYLREEKDAQIRGIPHRST